MKTSFYRFAALLIFAAALTAGCGERTDDMRLLYWNIQNGMWSDQSNGYDNFVAWVKATIPTYACGARPSRSISRVRRRGWIPSIAT